MIDNDEAKAPSSGRAFAEIPGAEQALLDSTLLRYLPEDVRERVLDALDVRHYGDGALLFDENAAPETGVHVLLRGQVDVYAREGAKMGALLASVHPGALLGEYRAIMDSDGRVFVRAATAVSTAVIGRDDFLLLLDNHPELTRQLMRHLITTVRKLSNRVDDVERLDSAMKTTRMLLLRASI